MRLTNPKATAPSLGPVRRADIVTAIAAEAIITYGINIGVFEPVADHQPDDDAKVSYTLAPLARRLLETEIREAA